MTNIAILIQRLSIIALPLLFAITLHEAAHGWVAHRKGDPTARLAGRLTMNPIVHIDPFGTILVPLFLYLISSGQFVFGQARPVPVNPANLKRPRTDMALVAVAGPGTNLLLAILSGFFLRIILIFNPDLPQLLDFSRGGVAGEWSAALLVPLSWMLIESVQINVLFMVFNLIPVPPLDGGRVAVGILPYNASRTLASVEPFGIPFIMLLVLVDPLGVMRGVVYPIMGFFIRSILG